MPEPEPFEDVVARIETQSDRTIEERLTTLMLLFLTATERGIVLPRMRELAAQLNACLRVYFTLNRKKDDDGHSAEAGSAVRRYAESFTTAAGQEREFHPAVAGPGRDDDGDGDASPDYGFGDTDADPAPDSA